MKFLALAPDNEAVVIEAPDIEKARRWAKVRFAENRGPEELLVVETGEEAVAEVILP